MKGTRVTVKVAGIQRERRFSPGTKARVIKAWQAHMRAKLTKQYSAATDRATKRDTLKADADRYYRLIRHLSDWVSRRSEIRAWFPLIGDSHRHMVTAQDVLRARGAWLEAGTAPKTVNNRVSALRNLYRLLDGSDAVTPCDGIVPLHVPKSPPRVVTPALVNTVLANLLTRSTQTDRRGRPNPHALQDRARLMVLASTGKRPCEVERAEPRDVDMARRVWYVRDAKGGWSEGVYLNDEMLAAWEAFIDAEAWGAIPAHFSRRLRLAGWPADVKPYQLRHSTWIEASERGADLSDIQAGAGHRNIRTTRQHYVPVLNSRMQKLSERLEGRFGWRPRLAGGQSGEKTH